VWRHGGMEGVEAISCWLGGRMCMDEFWLKVQ